MTYSSATHACLLTRPGENLGGLSVGDRKKRLNRRLRCPMRVSPVANETRRHRAQKLRDLGRAAPARRRDGANDVP
jgi:hypothetical protein